MLITAASMDKLCGKIIEDPFQNPCAFNSGTLGRIQDFVTMIKSFTVRLKTENAFELASGISTSTGLLRELYSDKTPEGLSRYENVQELLNGIREFVDTGRSITPRGDEEVNQDRDAIRTLDAFYAGYCIVYWFWWWRSGKWWQSKYDDHSCCKRSWVSSCVHCWIGRKFISQMSMDSRKIWKKREGCSM